MSETEANGKFSRRGLLTAGGLGGAAMLLAACTSEKPAAATAAAVSGTGSAQAGKKVMFIVHDKNSFFAPVQAGFEDFGKAMGWTTQFNGPSPQDVQQTVDMQKNALNSKPDGVIFTCIDPTAFDANIQQAIDSKIPVVLSNVATGADKKFRIGFVGQSFVTAGIDAGLLVAKYAKEHTGQTSGVIIVGNFAPGNSALDDRATGIKQGVDQFNQKNGTNYTTELLVTSTDETKAVGAIDARYRKEPVVGWAMTAFDHQFVATWAKQNNLVGKFAVGGFDETAPVLEGIKDGGIDFTLGQNPYAQGWLAAAMVAEQIGAGYPGSNVDTGAEIVDKTNIDEIMIREANYA